MRVVALFGLCLWTLPSHGQDHLLLNEVLPGNQGITANNTGGSPDWIEVFNPTTKAVDLLGWRIAMAGRQHIFMRSLVVAAKSYELLWCDGRSTEGPDHIAFKLAREGGALLLITPDGMTVADVFSYPSIPGNVSIGRYPNATRSWSLFTTPTPGEMNRSGEGGRIQGTWKAPEADLGPGWIPAPSMLALRAEEGAVIHFTRDGSLPTPTHGERYATPISIEASTTVRAVAFGSGRLTSADRTATYLIGTPVGETFALSLAPADLWNDSTGIYTPGLFNNNTRTGRAWERPGTAAFAGMEPVRVDVRISGSGSRGARKRSFKLSADEAVFAFDDSTLVNEAFLRADATPHAWLRNTTLEELVRRYGLNLEVQPSRTTSLYLNAAFWGNYRWMPGKDANWLEQRSGAGSIDLLEGPGASVLNGGDDHYERALAMLLRGAPKDSLETLIDLKSLIDLACMDLWTGRADHEFNVRCYRPRERHGRWRWVLYDMDLWAPANENSVQRMSLAAAPETPFVPQLLDHPELRIAVLARITALQASAFDQAAEVADSLQRSHRPGLEANFRRWELELDMPHPDTSLAMLKEFAKERPSHLFEDLARYTGRKTHVVVIDVPPAEQATLLIDGLMLAPGKQKVRCFGGVPVPIELRMKKGYEFAGWKGANLDLASGSVDLSRTKDLRPLMRVVAP